MKRKIGVIMSGVLMVFEMLSTMLYTPYLIRTLGQSEYGIYTLVLSVSAYLVLLDLGVGNSIVRYVSKYRANGEDDEQRRFLGIANVYYAIIAFVVLVLGTVVIIALPELFSKGLTTAEIGQAKKLMALTVINIAITLGTSPYMHILTAYEKFFLSKGISIIQIVIRTIASVILLYLGFGSIGVVAVNLILNIIMRLFVICYVSIKMKLLPTFHNIRMSFIKNIVLYSVWILLQMIATHINHMADQVLIGMFAVSSSAILGIYGVGSQINQYFQSVATAFTGVLMPGVVKLVEKGSSAEILQKEMERIGRIIFMVTGLIWSVFLVCGQQFVNLWAGDENSKAYIVALLLMTPHVFIMSQSIGTQILWAKEKHKFQAILKLIIVLLNVAVTIVLIKEWDALMGATVGTMLSLLLGDVLVMQIVFKKDIGIKLLSYYKNTFVKGIAPSIIITILCGLAVSNVAVFSGWFDFVFKAGIMVVVYIICMLSFGMNKSEKEMLKSISTNLIRNKN